MKRLTSLLLLLSSVLAHAGVNPVPGFPLSLKLDGTEALIISQGMKAAQGISLDASSVQTTYLRCTESGDMGNIFCYGAFMKSMPSSFNTSVMKILTDARKIIIENSGGKISLAQGAVVSVKAAKCEKTGDSTQCQLDFSTGGLN